MHKSIEGHVVVKSEGRTALAKMNENKAAEPDEIVIEMLDLR